jgi:hypothetical protein
MDCPICFNAITPETGVMTTSCGHSYHFSCIAGWYAKEETCPCCRAAAKSTEIMPTDDEDDEDEDEDDEDEDEVEFTRDSLNAWLVSRGGTGQINENVCSEVAGFTYVELNFLSLGNGGRKVSGSEWRWLLNGMPVETAASILVDVLNPEE